MILTKKQNGQKKLTQTTPKLQVDKHGEWLEGVRKIISPNCDQRPDDAELDLLVIHSISLPPGEFGGDYIDQLFTNSLDPDHHPYFKEVASHRVSAHILINRVGELTQYVSFNQRAWHAGESEFEGQTNCNDYSIGIELEGCNSKDFTQAQYEMLINITSAIIQFWPKITKQRIAGHCHIAPDRKTDPGPTFNWDSYYSSLV